jgi:hypothetical protein
MITVQYGPKYLNIGKVFRHLIIVRNDGFARGIYLIISLPLLLLKISSKKAGLP